MATLTEIALSRLLNQFSDAQKLVELFIRILNRFEDSNNILEYLLTKRFLDTAEGVWLDVIGDIIGIPRPYEPIEDDEIFTFKSIGQADDPDKGWGTITSSTIGGKFQTIEGITTDQLASDDVYLNNIKAKAYVTFTKGTVHDVWGLVNFVYPTLTDITVTIPKIGEVKIETTPTLQAYERRVIRNLSPVVAGFSTTV
jgi:hypothetical protein